MDAINAENFHSLSIFNVTVIVMSKMSAMTKCRTKMPVWVYENNNPSCRRTVSQVFLFTADLIWSTQICRHNNISYRILVTWAVEWWIITYGASYVSKSYIDIYRRRRLSKVFSCRVNVFSERLPSRRAFHTGTVKAKAPLTSALSAAPHLQSMQTIDEDDLS